MTVEGQEYLGVSDPLSGRLASIGQVEEPQFGQAAAVAIVLTGASKEFIQSVHATARQIEGARNDLMGCVRWRDTEIITPLIRCPRGACRRRQSIGRVSASGSCR